MDKPLNPTSTLTHFDEHAVTIARRQYFQPEDKSLEGMFARVAHWVAGPETGDDKEAYTRAFYDLMASKRFCPGGRVLAGAATGHGNVLNCFVPDGSPAIPGTDAWVLRLATKLALVTKVGGGNGLCLDPIKARRPYAGPSGKLYITISPEHPDYQKVQSGTYMDLVHGKYVTKGYRAAKFLEQSALPHNLPAHSVGDSVESIWQGAADAIYRLLKGENVLLDLSNLRAEGTPVKGSGGNSSGPSSFAVEVFDNFALFASLGGAEYAGPVATLRYVFAPTLRVIRQGGCLHPDTLVHTSRGTLRLSEFVDPYQYGWQEHYLKVATDEGWKDSPRGFNNGNAQTLKVRLDNGQEIQGTPNHKLKVMRETGERVWVELSELQAGDWVIQVLDQHTGAPVTLSSLDHLHHNSTVITTPEVLNERLAFFLGYLWGDGFMSTGHRVGMAVAKTSPMMQEAPQLFKDLFGLEVGIEEKDGDGSVVFVVKSAALSDWLKLNGLEKGKATQLRLPRAVRQSPRPVVGAFMRGLFEADGSVTHGYPTLSSASKELLQDVSVMIGGLGIPSKLSYKPPSENRYSKHASYCLSVRSAKGLERYLERVGALEGSRFMALYDVQPDTARESAWPLPHAQALLQEAFANAPAGAKGRPSAYTPVRKTLSRYIRGERGLTATGYISLKENQLMGSSLAEFDYSEYYVQVKRIEEGGRILTLDLSVDENCTYLANGIVSHNTRRGAGMATISATHPDVQDFITCKDLQREKDEGDISTFNISVLVTDDFMKGERGQSGTLHDIANHAWQTGEPGLIFIDRINENSAMREALGDIRATNPCVTDDTWVMTHLGAQQVKELVGKDFCAVVDGERHRAAPGGFWSTGVKQVYRLVTKRGFELRLTSNHKLLKVTRQTRYTQRTEWIELANLEVGDSITLHNHRDALAWSGEGSFDEGWLLGSLVGDGTFQVDKAEPRACLDYWGETREPMASLVRDRLVSIGETANVWVTEGQDKVRFSSATLARMAARYGIVHGCKTVTDEVEKASQDFYHGFLRGLFDADGSVQGNHIKGVSVRLAQSNLELLKRVQRMLSRLGILSAIYEQRREAGYRSLPDGRGGSQDYYTQSQHELVISGDNILFFMECINFDDAAKKERLEHLLGRYKRELNRERFSDEIALIIQEGEEEVFDVSIEQVHEFDANGISAHNCGEIPLYPGEPCDLGAINLSEYVRTPNCGTDGFDWDGFAADVRTCIRFLDNVLDVNRFALADNREMSMRLRRLGLGIMGMADALIKMGYCYDSAAGREAVRDMIAALRDNAFLASQALAEERGVFPDYDKSSLSTPRRNVALLTVAPTGTTSMLMGVSSGIEPVFAPFIYRKIGDSYAALIHPLFQELLAEHAPHPDYRKGNAWDIEKVVAQVQENHGSVQGLEFIPESIRRVLVCAHDIAPEDHVRMQGVVQKTFDEGGEMLSNSISKTINMPNNATVHNVFDAYSLAFETGCKGITVYRDGSRDFQVLSTSTKSEKKEEKPAPAPLAAKPAPQAVADPKPALPLKPERLPGEPLFDRPVRLTGFTDAVKLTMPNGEKRGFYVSVNKQDGLPTEVFIVSGKAGDEANADSEALGRMVSIALQYGVPAEAIVKTLRGINGGMYGSYQGRMVASKADLIAVALETAGVENVLNKGNCPDCAAPLRFEEGCQKCESCGYSKCG